MTPDTQRFLGTLSAHAGFFDAARPVQIARAPGRLDVMGGIADYSGSLVLQLPIAAAAFAAAQWSADTIVRVRTTHASAAHGHAEVAAEITDLIGDYAAVRARVSADPGRHWAAYVAGAITVLARERGIVFDRGVRWLLSSDVPAGKGVSSSAAIEVAAMQALCALLDLRLDGRDLALLCQKVENLVVGAPCGVMDQMTAACGEANALLALRCQPAELEPAVAIPDAIEFHGVDSGIRHAVTGADYASVRVGAFMGLGIVNALVGRTEGRSARRTARRAPERARVAYLADLTPAEWEAEFRDRVPERMTGAEYLATYGGFADTVTTIDPARTYAIRQPTAHPIYEHDRVRRFRALLQGAPADDDTLARMGELMYQSHESYTACGLGSSGTDAIVDLVRQAGPARGLFGAKITGGGSGGTVAVLVRKGSRAAVDEVAAAYARATGRPAAVISGSSDGAIRCTAGGEGIGVNKI